MSYSRAVQTANDYADAATLRCPGAVRVNLDVTSAGIYYELGQGTAGVLWESEVPMLPGFRSLDRRCDAVRVRSLAPGRPAKVTIDAAVEAEVAGA